MVDCRIQRYLRSVVGREREPVPAGGFVLYVHPSNSHPYLNYAIPEDRATEDDGRELVRAAQRRGLVPRLEFLESCFPWVESALTLSGFKREARHRLMSCSRDEYRAVAEDVDLELVTGGSPFVRSMLTVMRAAFGEKPPRDDEVSGWDGRAIAAVVAGEVLGGAQWTPVIDGMSEIVGVAVAARVRRRGIGAALTSAATRAAFADGASVAMLTPGDDDTARVYARAGFRDTSTMIHLRHMP